MYLTNQHPLGSGFFRTRWSGMPLGHAPAGLRLISDELLPALRRINTEEVR